MTAQKILLLPGDGIGPEVIAEARKVIDALRAGGIALDVEYGLIGAAAYDAEGTPLPDRSLALARECDAVLMGAVGSPAHGELGWESRPEAGLLTIRSALNLFANLRPARLFPQLSSASSLKPEVVSGFDVLFVRELIGDIYFGEPRGERVNADNQREAFNTMVYAEDEIERIAHVAFQFARERTARVCSVDKANVLEVSKLWRQVVDAVAKGYPEVELRHLYEPVHGSAPDIAGTGKANPLAAILSLAMLLRYSLKQIKAADLVESAVQQALGKVRTPDLDSSVPVVTTAEMGDLVASFCTVGSASAYACRSSGSANRAGGRS